MNASIPVDEARVLCDSLAYVLERLPG